MLNRTAPKAIVVALLLATCGTATAQQAAARPAENAWIDGYTLFMLDEGADVHGARRLIQAHGGRVALVLPPRILTGWSGPEDDAQLLGRAGIRSIHRNAESLPRGIADRVSQASMRFFERFTSGELQRDELDKPALPAQFPPGTDAFPPADLSEFDVLRNLENLGLGRAAKLQSGSTLTANSDHMIGTVSVSLFFVESDGSGADEDKYSWSASDEGDVFDEVAEALSWWSDQANDFSDCWVTFVINAHYATDDPRCSQWREPVTRSSSDFSLAVNDILTNFGYTSGSHLSRCAAYNLAQRQEYATDWAYSAFIAANPTGNTSFDDGFAAWAFLGGPYVSLLQRSFNWSFKRVFAHESGHIFGACDEYHIEGYGGCSSCNECWTTGVDNGNCEACNDSPATCMMRSNSWALCDYTAGQIGWWRTPCSAGALPAPIVDSISPESMIQGVAGELMINGEYFNVGLEADLGASVEIEEVELISSALARLRVAVDLDAQPGARDLVITGPDGQSTTLTNAFTVRSTPTHYVSLAGSNSHPFETPATAAHSLAAALSASSTGDTIRLVPGTYAPFALGKTLVIEGGWSSAFVSRNPAALQSRIERIGTGPVVSIEGVGVAPVLDGLVFTGGKGDLIATPELGSTRSGGGLLCFEASPIIRNCVFENNSAGTLGTQGVGGGAFLWNSQATFENCVFRGNSSGRGAALYLLGSQATLRGNLFENNEVLPYQTFASGAGIALLESEIEMHGDVLRMNTGADTGGALHVQSCARVDLNGVRILDHWAAGFGGALWANDSELRLQACEIVRNSSALSGGGIFASSGSLVIEATVLAGNEAGQLGGALYANNTAPSLRNLSIVHNAAALGSGIYMTDVLAGARVDNSIVAHNVHGGIAIGVGEPPVVDWNAYWQNDNLDLLGVGPGANDLHMDPLLVAPASFDVHLAVHSPCIDSGDPQLQDLDGSASDRGAFGGPLAIAAAPERIDGLTATLARAGTRVTWYPSSAPDVMSYLLFRGEHDGFSPTPENLVATVSSPNTSFVDAPEFGAAWYAVSAVNLLGYAGGYSVRVQGEAPTDAGIPGRQRLELRPIFPNPTNPGAWIEFGLPLSNSVQLMVYNAQGRRMRTLASGLRRPGSHRVFWDGRDDHGREVSSGIYWVRMSTAGRNLVQKLTIVH